MGCDNPLRHFFGLQRFPGTSLSSLGRFVELHETDSGEHRPLKRKGVALYSRRGLKTSGSGVKGRESMMYQVKADDNGKTYTLPWYSPQAHAAMRRGAELESERKSQDRREGGGNPARF